MTDFLCVSCPAVFLTVFFFEQRDPDSQRHPDNGCASRSLFHHLILSSAVNGCHACKENNAKLNIYIYIYIYIYYIILYISSRCCCILEGLFNSWSTYVQIKACNYKEHVLFFRDRKKTPPNIKVATCLAWPWTETYTIRRWQPCHFAISFIRLKKSVIVLLLVKFMIFFSRVSNLMSL